jgi:hypothetical protein
MKLRTVFATVAALACAAALGAEPPASPSATPIKHTSLKACNQKADAKKLTGPARAQYVKGCQGSKAS